MRKSDVGIAKSVVKKRQKCRTMEIAVLHNNIAVNADKIEDVDVLLKKHYGLDLHLNNQLIFIKNIIGDNHEYREKFKRTHVNQWMRASCYVFQY